jgi:hypothetical protein
LIHFGGFGLSTPVFNLILIVIEYDLCKVHMPRDILLLDPRPVKGVCKPQKKRACQLKYMKKIQVVTRKLNAAKELLRRHELRFPQESSFAFQAKVNMFTTDRAKLVKKLKACRNISCKSKKKNQDQVEHRS